MVQTLRYLLACITTQRIMHHWGVFWGVPVEKLLLYIEMYPIPDLVSICFSVGLTWCVLMYKYQYTNNYHTSWSWGKWRGHSDFERSIIKMGFEDKALVVTESLQGLPYWGGKMMSWTTVAKAMIAQSSRSTYTCRRRVLNTWFWWCWKLIEWSHVNFHICYIFSLWCTSVKAKHFQITLRGVHLTGDIGPIFRGMVGTWSIYIFLGGGCLAKRNCH